MIQLLSQQKPGCNGAGAAAAPTQLHSGFCWLNSSGTLCKSDMHYNETH